jgi:hypothetical protein
MSIIHRSNHLHLLSRWLSLSLAVSLFANLRFQRYEGAGFSGDEMRSFNVVLSLKWRLAYYIVSHPGLPLGIVNENLDLV